MVAYVFTPFAKYLLQIETMTLLRDISVSIFVLKGMLNILFKGSILNQKKVYLLIFLSIIMAYTIVLTLLHSSNLIQVILSLREYVFPFLLILAFIVYSEQSLDKLIYYFFIACVPLTTLNLLAYFTLIDVNYSPYVFHNSGVPEIRIVAGLAIPRMQNFFGTSTGGGGLMHMILLILSTIYWTQTKNPFYLFVACQFVLAIFLTLSVTPIIGAVIYFGTIMLSNTANVRIIILSLVAIVVFSFTTFEHAGGETFFWEYGHDIFKDQLSIYSNYNLSEQIFGVGFDLKTTLVDRNINIPRDFGVLSPLIFGGLISFTLWVFFGSMIFYIMKRSGTLNSIKLENVLILLPLCFIHGFGPTTVPFSLLFALGVAKITQKI